MLAEVADVHCSMLKTIVEEQDTSLHLLLTGDLNALLNNVLSDSSNPLQGIVINFYTVLHSIATFHKNTLARLISENFIMLNSVLIPRHTNWEQVIANHCKFVDGIELIYFQAFGQFVDIHLNAALQCVFEIFYKRIDIFRSKYQLLLEMGELHFRMLKEIRSVHFHELGALSFKHLRTSQHVALNAGGHASEVYVPVNMGTSPKHLVFDYYETLKFVAVEHNKSLMSFVISMYHAFWELAVEM